MADPKLIYVPGRSGEIRDQVLRDLRLGAIDTGLVADPNTAEGSDYFLLSTALENWGMLALQNVQVHADAMNVLNATGQDLEDIRIAEGVEEIKPSKSRGRIRIETTGATTILAGQRFTYPNGQQGTVITTTVNPSNYAEIDVESVGTGSVTRLAAGETVRFSPTPVNVQTEAKVSRYYPLTGGTDFETDDRKRARILNVRRNKPAAGNWAQVRQVILDNFPGIQDVYSYPALGGPGSSLIVPIRDFDFEINDFTRVVNSADLQRMRQLIWSKFPTWADTYLRAVAEENIDVTLLVTIPDSAQAGGNGLGWFDETPWPQLVGGDSNTVAISAISADYVTVTVDAGTSTSPVAGQTNIAWWSPVDLVFYTALVLSVTGSAGAWVCVLDRPLVGEDGDGAAIGDYICPAATNMRGYGEKWIEIMRALGPGEMTADAGRLPHSLRKPNVTDEDASSITNTVFGAFKNAFPEITNIDFGYTSATAPTVPANVDLSPNVLFPRRFGVYKQ